jgi:cell wall-associated NlpC family hydrolase
MATYREAPDAPVRLAAIANRALELRGTPYRLGGERPDTGLDCSGLVRYVFSEAGVDLPRTVAEQFRVGMRADERALRAGDLIFFDTFEPGPSHVGIAIDAQSFVHAPGSGGVVRVDQISSPYWRSRIRGVRRIALD